MTATDKKELLALRYELEALTIDFWHEVDHKGGQNAADYYVEDALFVTSVQEYRGREAIRAFYERRRARAMPRLSIHVVQNFRIEVESASRVHCRYVMSLFAADGVPVLESRPAIMMAMAHETVALQADGSWLHESRVVHPLFRDGTPTTG
jgi:ketosteroid isomerase-like protein